MSNPQGLREIHRTIASVVVMSADGKMLLGRKDPSRGGVYPNAWHIPGGGVERGETLEDAARRECFEEAGIDLSEVVLRRLQQVGKGAAEKTLGSGEQVWVVMEFSRFEAQLSEDADKVELHPRDDLRDLRWFDREELARIDLIPGGRQFFVDAGYLTQDD